MSEEPVIARNAPYPVELLAAHRYAWCACGLSKSQPFCDGSHTMSKSGALPIIFTQEKDATVYLCGCKKAAQAPICDGTHRGL